MLKYQCQEKEEILKETSHLNKFLTTQESSYSKGHQFKSRHVDTITSITWMRQHTLRFVIFPRSLYEQRFNMQQCSWIAFPIISTDKVTQTELDLLMMVRVLGSLVHIPKRRIRVVHQLWQTMSISSWDFLFNLYYSL